MKRVGQFLVVGCVVLAACSRKAPDPDVASTTETTSAIMMETSGRSQSSSPPPASFLEPEPLLTRNVEATLARDPALSSLARNVSVTAERGNVTLSGSVPDHATREAAEKLASETPGVVRVYSDVEVSPLRDANGTESDENIAFAIQRALHSDPAIDAELVTIEVVNGYVTVRGIARNEASKEAVLRAIDDTPGVGAVGDELRTGPAPTASAAEIQ